MSAAGVFAGMAGRMLAQAAGSQRLLILTYHRVLAQPDPLLPEEPCRAEFTRHITILKRHFNLLPLGEALARLRAGTLPARSLAITFDDGYTDNYLHALPILESHGVPAICFVATDYLDGGCMFNDLVIEVVRHAPGPALNADGLGLGELRLGSAESRRSTIQRILDAIKYEPPAARLQHAQSLALTAGVPAPENLMMTAEQVREMARRGMAIGAHTRTHPILSKVTQEEARQEIRGSRERLESLLGQSVPLFAYPNGRSGRDFTDRDVEEVRAAGFESAVTTDWGVATPKSDPLRLPRISIASQRGDLLALRLGKYFFG